MSKIRLYLECEKFFDILICVSYKFKESIEVFLMIWLNQGKIWLTETDIIDHELFAKCYIMCFTWQSKM